MNKLLAALVPYEFVTNTPAVPAVPGGVVAVMVVSFTTVKLDTAGVEDVITRLPVPEAATATNRSLPNFTLNELLLAAEVRRVQAIPFGLVITAPVSETATNRPLP